jgi:hypothetical protein
MILPSLASALAALLTPPVRDVAGFPVERAKGVHRQAAPPAADEAPAVRFVRPERPPCPFGGGRREQGGFHQLKTRLLGERKSGRVYVFGG